MSQLNINRIISAPMYQINMINNILNYDYDKYARLNSNVSRLFNIVSK